MNANVLPMRPMQVSPADAEKLAAYYVALAVDPEIVHAPAIVRAQLVAKVIAGQRLAQACFVAAPGGGDFDRLHAMASVMRSDETIAAEKGWQW